MIKSGSILPLITLIFARDVFIFLRYWPFMSKETFKNPNLMVATDSP